MLTANKELPKPNSIAVAVVIACTTLLPHQSLPAETASKMNGGQLA